MKVLYQLQSTSCSRYVLQGLKFISNDHSVTLNEFDFLLQKSDYRFLVDLDYGRLGPFACLLFVSFHL